MITHIVMWKFKQEAEGAGKAQNLVRAKALLDACAQLVPGTLRFEVAIARPGHRGHGVGPLGVLEESRPAAGE